MLSMCSSGIVVALKLLYLLSLSKASLAVAMILWQNAVYFNGLHRFCRVAGTLPFLVLELRTRLNLRYWVMRLSRLALHSHSRDRLPAVRSAGFLLLRDGHTIFDFFKTLALSDVSPPALG